MTAAAKLRAPDAPELVPPSEPSDSPFAETPRGAPVVAADQDRRGPLRPGRLISSRERVRGETICGLFRAADIVVAVAIAWAAFDIAHPLGLWISPFGLAAPYLCGALAMAYGLALVDGYAFRTREPLSAHLGRVSGAIGLIALAMAMSLALSGAPRAVIEALGLWLALEVLTIHVLHTLWWSTVRKLRRSGRLIPNVVVVGATPNAKRLIAKALDSREIAVLGVFDDRKSRASDGLRGVPYLGDTSQLIGHRIMPYVDRVVITVSSTAQARVQGLVDKLRVLPNEITLFVDLGEPGSDSFLLSRLADIPLARVSGGDIDHRKALAKRIQDLAFGALALAFTAPAMLLIAAAIKLDSPGPVFFRQRRQGFNNEEIVVWKFRSMRHELRDEAGVRQVEADDARVTRVGRLIRRTSLDELPQLFNVLRGEMSLVGPRPHAPDMKTGDVESSQLVACYAHRHRIKPGMTGWAAIRGSRGPMETADSVRRRVAFDVEYIERQSLWFDLYIMAVTLPCLLGDRAAAR